MKIVNMHEAKTHLSRLVGEEFVIARAGTPVARVVPIVPEYGTRRFGFLSGEASVPEDFDTLGFDEIAADFES